MANTDFPNINGHEYSWASVTLKFGTFKTNKASSCTYGDGLEPGLIDAAATTPAGWTRGKWQGDDISVEFPLSEGQALIDALGDGFGKKTLQLIVSYADDGMPTITHENKAVRITKVAENPGGSGSDPSKMTFTMKALVPWKRNDKAIV